MSSTITTTRGMERKSSVPLLRRPSPLGNATARSTSLPPLTAFAVSPPPEKPESFVSRYVYTPLFFASFLLSFLLIDNRNHNRTTGGRCDEAKGRDKKPWIWRAKHMKLARLEIGQALDMRHSVALVIVVAIGAGCMGLWWMMVWMCRAAGKLLGLG